MTAPLAREIAADKTVHLVWPYQSPWRIGAGFCPDLGRSLKFSFKDFKQLLMLMTWSLLSEGHWGKGGKVARETQGS